MKSSTSKQFKLADLIDGLDVTIKGDSNCLITGVATLEQSKHGHITLLTNQKYRKHLTTTGASAVILAATDATDCPVTAVISSNPHYIYAKIAAYFSEYQSGPQGIHSTAIVGKDCQIDGAAYIGPHVVIGEHVTIAAGAFIGPGCVIGDFTTIGENVKLDANVSIYQNVKIGPRSHIASGVIIGSDGFGFANQKGNWHKVPQLGGVLIGADVDIGANTTIDRGAIEDTVIEDGVKLDNLIQIAHNVHIGENTVIAACVALAGSTLIGKNCMIGGGTCITGHISICDHTKITGMTAITKSITEPGMYSSGLMGVVPTSKFRKNSARFNRLENLVQRIKTLENKLQESKERK